MRVVELFVVEPLQTQDGIDGIITLNVEHILNGTPLTVAIALGNLIAFEPVTTSFFREKEHCLVHCCRVNELREILFAMASSLCSYTTSCLFAELTQWCALDVAHVAHCDNNGIVGVEILGIELFTRIFNLRAAHIAIFFFYLVELILHHLLAQFWIIQNLLQVSNLPF